MNEPMMIDIGEACLKAVNAIAANEERLYALVPDLCEDISLSALILGIALEFIGGTKQETAFIAYAQARLIQIEMQADMMKGEVN